MVIWAVSLSTMKLIPHCLTAQLKIDLVFWVCHSLVPLSQPSPKQCFTPISNIIERCASTHFEEIQLAPSSIGISPLITTHPPIFQHWWVRSSTLFYRSFILVMIRSPGFGSISSDKTLFSNSFSLWLQKKNLNLATTYKSPAHSSTGTRSNLTEFSHCL